MNGMESKVCQTSDKYHALSHVWNLHLNFCVCACNEIGEEITRKEEEILRESLSTENKMVIG